jgi:D-serine deaminase-like pyridoxal phosphate-dependent protein
VCEVKDIALSVLATVNGHRADKGWTLIDAGWMALSRDRGTARQQHDQGYGLVCDIDGRPYSDLIVIDSHQEHGVIAHRNGKKDKMPALPVGTRVRILPNHACATGAQHEGYNVVEGKREVLARWERFSGW